MNRRFAWIGAASLVQEQCEVQELHFHMGSGSIQTAMLPMVRGRGTEGRDTGYHHRVPDILGISTPFAVDMRVALAAMVRPDIL